MCNLYSITTNQEAIRALFRVVNRYIGNLAPMPGVFPDYPAPVIRNAGTEREPAFLTARIDLATPIWWISHGHEGWRRRKARRAGCGCRFLQWASR